MGYDVYYLTPTKEVVCRYCAPYYRQALIEPSSELPDEGSICKVCGAVWEQWWRPTKRTGVM